jgi:hypothetical protein
MNTLIIKSASIERLDALFDLLRNGTQNSAQNGGRTDILTHRHWFDTIQKSYDRCRPVSYPFDESFSKRDTSTLIGKELHQKYDRVIVLTSNLSGSGHHNVLETAFLFGENVFTFNVNGTLEPFPCSRLKSDALKRVALSPVVLSGTLLMWALCGGLLLALLVRRSLRLLTMSGVKR